MAEPGQATPGPQPTLENTRGELQRVTASYHPQRRMIAVVLQTTFNKVKFLLVSVRRLAERKWDNFTRRILVSTWRRRVQLTPQAYYEIQTEPGSMTTTTTQTDEIQEDSYQAYLLWAKAADPMTIFYHPLIQLAINRGIVAPVTRSLERAERNPNRSHPYSPARTSEVRTNAYEQCQCLHQLTTPFREDKSVAVLIGRDEDQVTDDEFSDQEFLPGYNVGLPHTDDEGL